MALANTERESKLENRCIAYCMKHNGMTVKIVGSKGWPDRIFVTEEGKILFCEFKAVWGHISAMQEYVADKLHARGIEVYIITGFKQFKETYNAV